MIRLPLTIIDKYFLIRFDFSARCQFEKVGRLHVIIKSIMIFRMIQEVFYVRLKNFSMDFEKIGCQLLI